MKKEIFEVRPVQNDPEELKTLAAFCHALAAFDGHQASVDPVKLKETLFQQNTNVRAFLGYRYNEPIGFILAYECFTVYHGERGLYVPGAYVVEKYRHLGYGVKMFKYLARYALEHHFDFMNWIVDETNEKANQIYQKMGAQISKGWSYIRVSRAILEKARAGEG